MGDIIRLPDSEGPLKIHLPVWKYIVLHHSKTKDGSVVDWNAIRNYHINNCGWSDIGYHFGIERLGNDYNVLVGRPLTDYGAHTKGKNEIAIGVCFVGDYDTEVPPDDMMMFGIKYVVVPLMATYRIPINHVVKHNRFAQYKTCAGTKFSIGHFRQLVRDYCVKWS